MLRFDCRWRFSAAVEPISHFPPFFQVADSEIGDYCVGLGIRMETEKSHASSEQDDDCISSPLPSCSSSFAGSSELNQEEEWNAGRFMTGMTRLIVSMIGSFGSTASPSSSLHVSDWDWSNMAESEFEELCVFHVPDRTEEDNETKNQCKALESLPKNLQLKASKEIPNVQLPIH